MSENNVVAKTKSAAAGLTLPVESILQSMRDDEVLPDCTVGSGIFMTAAMEYMIAEIVELAGNNARDYGGSTIQAVHIKTAVERDPELKVAYKNIEIEVGENEGRGWRKLMGLDRKSITERLALRWAEEERDTILVVGKSGGTVSVVNLKRSADEAELPVGTEKSKKTLTDAGFIMLRLDPLFDDIEVCKVILGFIVCPACGGVDMCLECGFCSKSCKMGFETSNAETRCQSICQECEIPYCSSCDIAEKAICATCEECYFCTDCALNLTYNRWVECDCGFQCYDCSYGCMNRDYCHNLVCPKCAALPESYGEIWETAGFNHPNLVACRDCESIITEVWEAGGMKIPPEAMPIVPDGIEEVSEELEELHEDDMQLVM